MRFRSTHVNAYDYLSVLFATMIMMVVKLTNTNVAEKEIDSWTRVKATLLMLQMEKTMMLMPLSIAATAHVLFFLTYFMHGQDEM